MCKTFYVDFVFFVVFGSTRSLKMHIRNIDLIILYLKKQQSKYVFKNR